MISKVPLLLVNDYRLCHLLRLKHVYVFILPQKFDISRQFCNIVIKKHGYLSSSSKGRSLSQKMSVNTDIQDTFQGKTDRFEGVTVISNHESCGAEEFQEKLRNSLLMWRSNQRRGIWFKVHLDQSSWVPILVQNGFKYHHAKEDYVMLYLWLPNTESNNVPNYAHTMIGVGAVVTNDRNQVLVVREKYFYKVPMWKLPGGYVEPGENLVDAAIREVSEETNIEAKFESILTLRHTHYGMFGCSDIYVVVNLKAVTENITKCDREIAECQWMDIEEYLSHPNIHELNRFFVQKLLDYRKHDIKIDCNHGVHQLLQKPYTVYSAEVDKGESRQNNEQRSTLTQESKSTLEST